MFWVFSYLVRKSKNLIDAWNMLKVYKCIQKREVVIFFKLLFESSSPSQFLQMDFLFSFAYIRFFSYCTDLVLF